MASNGGCCILQMSAPLPNTLERVRKSSLVLPRPIGVVPADRAKWEPSGSSTMEQPWASSWSISTQSNPQAPQPLPFLQNKWNIRHAIHAAMQLPCQGKSNNNPPSSHGPILATLMLFCCWQEAARSSQRLS